MNGNEDIKEGKYKKILTVRISQEEIDMLDILKGSPYFINISKYLRATIKHLYEARINKAGRVK